MSSIFYTDKGGQSESLYTQIKDIIQSNVRVYPLEYNRYNI